MIHTWTMTSNLWAQQKNDNPFIASWTDESKSNLGKNHVNFYVFLNNGRRLFAWITQFIGLCLGSSVQIFPGSRKVFLFWIFSLRVWSPPLFQSLLQCCTMLRQRRHSCFDPGWVVISCELLATTASQILFCLWFFKICRFEALLFLTTLFVLFSIWILFDRFGWVHVFL